MPTTLETAGPRLYFLNSPFEAKERIKDIGGRWDGDRRAWWIGKAKLAAAEKLVAELNAAPTPDGKQAGDQTAEDARVYAKVEYKNRNYYVVAETATRCLLTVLDRSIHFWCDKSATALVREYKPHERTFRGRTTTSYTTLEGINAFIKKAKRAEAGEVPAGWCRDMEDGIVKPRGQCDMPED